MKQQEQSRDGKQPIAMKLEHRRSAAMVLLVLALVPLMVIACKKSDGGGCPEPREPTQATYGDDTLDPSTRERLVQAAIKDPKICDELTHPRIVLTADDLVLTGKTEHTLARRADLSASTIQRVDRLFFSLTSYRKQWKEIHPGNDFDGEAELVLDPMLETARAASLILTTSYAGFYGLRIHAGSSHFRFPSYVRGPPDGRYIDRVLHIQATDETTSIVRIHSAPCEKSPPLTVKNEVLGALVARLCKENPKIPKPTDPSERRTTCCVDAVEMRMLPTMRFSETARLMRAVTAALADQKPRVDGEERSDADVDRGFGGRAPKGVDIALLLAGSEPSMRQPKSPWRNISLYSPALEGSGHCTLPDGGYENDRPMDQLNSDGGLIFD